MLLGVAEDDILSTSRRLQCRWLVSGTIPLIQSDVPKIVLRDGGEMRRMRVANWEEEPVLYCHEPCDCGSSSALRVKGLLNLDRMCEWKSENWAPLVLDLEEP